MNIHDEYEENKIMLERFRNKAIKLIDRDEFKEAIEALCECIALESENNLIFFYKGRIKLPKKQDRIIKEAGEK